MPKVDEVGGGGGGGVCNTSSEEKLFQIFKEINSVILSLSACKPVWLMIDYNLIWTP